MKNTYGKMAAAGILGAVIYGIADGFLYLGTDVFSKDPTALWRIREWRGMASMSIGVVGSLLMFLGFLSLYRLYVEVFGRWGKVLITPSFLCIGGVLYMHYVLGVYSPLTFQSALKAGISESLAIQMIQNANAYMNPLTVVLVVLGYFTEIVILFGVISGKFGLKRRVLLFTYGGYAILVGVVLLIGRLTGEWGFVGSLESLFETTFFIPAYFYWSRREEKPCKDIGGNGMEITRE